jgi:hypothetical protein
MENQFGFLPGRSTMEAIFLLRQLMEIQRTKERLVYGLHRLGEGL